MTDSPNSSSSTNSAPNDEDALFLKALEDERQSLRAVQNLREDYIERFEELSDEAWIKNSGPSETDRLAESENIRQRLRDMESWDAHYTQRIAEGENLYREKKNAEAFLKAARERQVAVKNKREQQTLDSLISRSFNPTCNWDRNHTTELITLALWPERSNWLFRLRNRVHMLVHRH